MFLLGSGPHRRASNEHDRISEACDVVCGPATMSLTNSVYDGPIKG
jgi:hypothetical protein